MPYYRYKAADLAGNVSRGELHAANAFDVEMRLKQMGLYLVRLRPGTRPFQAFWRRRIPRRELIGLCFHMQQVLRAGIPLLDGLRDLVAVSEHPRLRAVLALVVDDVEGGCLLSDALAHHPRVFDPVFVALVRAAEASGELAPMFERLESRLKDQEALASEFTRMLIYPATVALAVLAAAAVLLFYLTPKLAALVESLNMSVPPVTRWLLALSAWLREPLPWFVAMAFALGLLALSLRLGREGLRARLDALLLHLPIIGKAIRKSALARFTGVFALLLQSGLNLPDALAACARTVGNRQLACRIIQAGELVAAGNTVSASFAQINLLPPLVVRMLHSGEQSGALAEAFDNAAWFFLRDARETVARSLKLLEPLLALLLGGLLAFLLLAVFLPVYQVIGEIRL